MLQVFKIFGSKAFVIEGVLLCHGSSTENPPVRRLQLFLAGYVQAMYMHTVVVNMTVLLMYTLKYYGDP